MNALTFFHPRWPVFYEDNHLLVMYKPAGLVMQRGKSGPANLLDLAKAWVKARYAKPGKVFIGMVHRLDAPVAGVLVLARTSKGAARLSAQIRQRRMEKNYLAVVQGRPPRQTGSLVHHLARNGRLSRPMPGATTTSQEARLCYRLLETAKSTSLVSVSLLTGRRHQIRAQMSALGCPIVGDVSYGADHRLPQGRIALLCHSLTFDHPTRKGAMTFTSPLPAGWPWPTGADKAPEEAHRPLWTFGAFKILQIPR
jgi:23S rRNA pseudouridine1911/1915/1917 synthase